MSILAQISPEAWEAAECLDGAIQIVFADSGIERRNQTGAVMLTIAKIVQNAIDKSGAAKTANNPEVKRA